MADTNSREGGQQPSNAESVRNLALILGITILLIMGVILVAFIIAGITNTKPTTTGTVITTDTVTPGNGATNNSDDNNGDTSTDTTDTSTTEPSGTNDTIVGSLNGGLGDSKPSNVAEPTSGGGDERVNAPETTTTEPTPTPTPTAPVEAGTETGSLYTYTASSGDSVSWLARRAMYAFMGDRGLGLSIGQRLYFETTLTNQSNPTSLSVGDIRTFSASTLESMYQAASNLPSGELSSWTTLAVNAGYI